ncbi:MAG: hypothetical protein WCT16_01755 [Candidatus Buchananbacteria bacterium]
MKAGNLRAGQYLIARGGWGIEHFIKIDSVGREENTAIVFTGNGKLLTHSRFKQPGQLFEILERKYGTLRPATKEEAENFRRLIIKRTRENLDSFFSPLLPPLF